jgi:hypothetical protein
MIFDSGLRPGSERAARVSEKCASYRSPVPLLRSTALHTMWTVESLRDLC